MNFLYTISWKREEEGGRIGEGGGGGELFPPSPAAAARPAIWTFWRHDAGAWNAAAVALSQLEGRLGGSKTKVCEKSEHVNS